MGDINREALKEAAAFTFWVNCMMQLPSADELVVELGRLACRDRAGAERRLSREGGWLDQIEAAHARIDDADPEGVPAEVIWINPGGSPR